MRIVNETLKTGLLPANAPPEDHRKWTKIPLAQPTATDVLSCLISDASAENCFDFAEWAQELGYSDDSIKASKIYGECLKIARDLRRVFGNETLDKLRPLVQEL